jgi:hypothetical protein
MHSKNLDAYLDQAGGINSLMPQAKRLLELRQVLLETLPAPLAEFANVANFRQGKVIIFAANSAIAAKLKLLGPGLKDRLVDRGVQVTALEIEVQPKQGTAPVPRKAAVLSDAARQALSRLESQLPDSQLKSSISALLESKVSER